MVRMGSYHDFEEARFNEDGMVRTQGLARGQAVGRRYQQPPPAATDTDATYNTNAQPHQRHDVDRHGVRHYIVGGFGAIPYPTRNGARDHTNSRDNNYNTSGSSTNTSR